MKKRIFVCVILIFMTVTMTAPGAMASNMAVERQIFDFITDEMGLNTAAACGILANIEAESNFRTGCFGDSGTSYGLCQWHNGRFDQLRSYCITQGMDYKTVEGQLSYLQYELRTRYRSTYATLKNVPNTSDGAYSAGYAWCYYYEVPASRNESSIRRGRNAQLKYWLRYGDGELGSVEESDGTEIVSEGFSGGLFEGPGHTEFYWEEEPEENVPETAAPENAGEPQLQIEEPETESEVQPRPSAKKFRYVPQHLPDLQVKVSPLSCLFVSMGPIKKEDPVPEPQREEDQEDEDEP